MKEAPYFSIGVTTYKRHDFLREALTSILTQSFGDFEVIVGNDDPGLPITADSLGIHDPRIRILNHQSNLGELGNMGQLLRQAKGRFFTWLADDDVYASGFLQAVHESHTRFGTLACVYTAYASGASPQPAPMGYANHMRVVPGRQFLRGYLAREICVLGCYGVFELEFLRALGGMQQLGQGFSPYSDNLLAIRSSAAENIGYIDSPLVHFRTHADSISYGSADLDAYLTAQLDFCTHAISVLDAPADKEAFRTNMFQLLSYWCLTYTFSVLRRSPKVRKGWVRDYFHFLKHHSARLGLLRIRLIAIFLTLLLKHMLFKFRHALSS